MRTKSEKRSEVAFAGIVRLLPFGLGRVAAPPHCQILWRIAYCSDNDELSLTPPSPNTSPTW